MLGKLLKYDLRAVFKGWIIAMITMVITALCSAGAIRANIEISLKPFSAELWVLQLSLSVVSMCGLALLAICFVSVYVLIAIRFYKHLFTDEGYLTFTLPVSRKQIFFSKVITATFWSALSFLVTLLCMAIFRATMLPVYEKMSYSDGLGVLLWLADDILLMFAERGVFGTVQTVLAVLILFANSLLVVGAAYFCITLGATVVKRGKLVVSIGVFYLMNMVYSFAINVMGTVSIIALLACFGERLPGEFEANLWFTVVMTVILVATLTLSATLYCTTLNIIERKLNLA